MLTAIVQKGTQLSMEIKINESTMAK